MKRFIINILLLALPIIVWGLIVVIVDPFNYFNFGIFNKDTKKSAESLNQLMYRTIDYIHFPCENMLIGDSRTELLPIDLIEKISKQKYKKLNTNAAKLNEIFELFYLAYKRKPIKRIVIGINFNMFNKYGYQNRISGLKKVLDDPLMYIYNKDVASATYVTIEQILKKKNVDSKPPMTREEFWKWSISTKASDWYGKYEFPNLLYSELLNFDRFTKKKGIEVIFIIVPHSEEFHKRLIEFGLGEEEKKFKKIMSSLNAKVYDFDYLNSITTNKNNFRDPVHYNDSIGNLIVREIWTNNLQFGKELDKNKKYIR
ncbi:hypothetical protein [Mucilaginibacter arboris]|uniref:Uncharacterized protein n=1 Tax=Mucilaginibacter arboris TaxID=2682090 RepID=A0A7K1SXI4_9SPHI|nr:hypothetical protein [Mucilaginibacter arboris]MVN22041.1 hypothetical protein [Mucilaginibacter arboris]